MKLRDMLASMVRTVVPVIVGLILGGLAAAGIDVDEASLETVIEGATVGAYYAVVRWLESRWSWAGWLLGWAVQPSYDRDDREPDDVKFA